jgi:hypothetical protein
MPLASSSSSSSAEKSILLSLPQSDLLGNNYKGALRRPDLVLIQLPKNDPELQKDFYAGRCQIVANQHSASLVSSCSSYKLVAVGTSNALVVWNELPSDDTSAPPPAKRSKKDHIVTACRLIQPGGSGASFLVGQDHVVDPHDLLAWFVQKEQQDASDVAAPRRVATCTLANIFQCSRLEMRMALSQIPSVAGFDRSDVEKGSDDCSYDPPDEQYWQLVSDEEVLCGQRALVEYAIEEDGVFQEDESVALFEEVAIGVSKRLVPLLMEYDETSATSEAAAGPTSGDQNVKERSLAIARKTIFLAQTERAKEKIDSRSVRLDPNVVSQDVFAWMGENTTRMLHLHSHSSLFQIAFYVLRDLFLEYPNYAMSDLLDKWAGRLPMGEMYEKCVSLEWLQEEGFVPQQLITENVDDSAAADAAGTSSATGKVIRLATPNTVLSWNKKQEIVGTPSKK